MVHCKSIQLAAFKTICFQVGWLSWQLDYMARNTWHSRLGGSHRGDCCDPPAGSIRRLLKCSMWVTVIQWKERFSPVLSELSLFNSLAAISEMGALFWTFGQVGESLFMGVLRVEAAAKAICAGVGEKSPLCPYLQAYQNTGIGPDNLQRSPSNLCHSRTLNSDLWLNDSF